MANTYQNNDNIREIDEIEFCVWGDDEISNYSVFGRNSLGVEISELYDNSEPKIGGMNDPRMGSRANGINCSTCGLSSCTGHFGHMTLTSHVFHTKYLDYVKKILKCICLSCSKILIHDNNNELVEILKHVKKEDRLQRIFEHVKNIKYCQGDNYGCGVPVTTIKLEINKNDCNIKMISEIVIQNIVEGDKTVSKKITQKLTATDCHDILSNISDHDCKILGFDPDVHRPEMMIHKIFPVPPISVRPSVEAEFMSSKVKEDDLTVKLIEILKANERLRKLSVSPNEVNYKSSSEHLLTFHIATYVNNNSCSIPKSAMRGTATKSITSRLKGKEGRLRGNLLGKRVNFCARTVITPNPMLDLYEIAVPRSIAMNVTFPETVTPQNIHYLQQIVNNGPNKYPGANYVFITKKKSLKNLKSVQIELQFGDIVERHLIDGDYVLLNRQPSLHKLSMMGQKIKVFDNPNYSTIQLNPAACNPYNADFDGDEMNIFSPRSVQSAVELKYIASLGKQLISPLSSLPILGLIMDGVVGSYLMTTDGVKLNRKEAIYILGNTTFNNWKKLSENREYTGKEIFSLVIPELININHGGVEINDGFIMKGRIGGKFIKDGKNNSLQHKIWNKHGMNKSISFLGDIQRLSSAFMLTRCFSVGIGDTLISKKTDEDINIYIQTKKTEINYLLTEIENNHNLYNPEQSENVIQSKLDSILGNVSKLIIDNTDDTNNFNLMIVSGSKGGETNIGQMNGCIGNQNLEQHRIPKKIRGRTMWYSFQNDDRPLSRGFIQNSFLSGMTPEEFICHNMTSREGLIDTAIKTSKSGYMSRKLGRMLDDNMVKHDGIIRGANDQIIQMFYGNNNTDSSKQYPINIPILSYGDSEIDELLKIKNDKTNDIIVRKIKKLLKKIRKAIIRDSYDNKNFGTSLMVPVNIQEIIDEIIHKRNKNRKETKIVDSKYIYEQMGFILDPFNTISISINDNINLKKDCKVNKRIFALTIYYYLSPIFCINKYKFTSKEFDKLRDDIIKKYNWAIVEPGEMIGMVAGQSCGEPLTQMTLNTFHHAGIGSFGAGSIGVPRVTEIYNVSKKIKTPLMMIYLNKGEKENGNRIASQINYLTVGDVIKDTSEYYDPFPLKKGSIMQKDNVEKVFYTTSERGPCKASIENNPLLIKIIINKRLMFEHDIRLIDIKSKFCNFWETQRINIKDSKTHVKRILENIYEICVLSNNDNDKHPAIHVRFNIREYDEEIIEQFSNIIKKIPLKGLENISGVTVNEIRKVSFDNDDNKPIVEKQLGIATQGINMKKIRYINGIDLNKTTCNDIRTIYETFGVEAARTALIRELGKVYKKYNSHIILISDFMTHPGFLVSIDRHGLQNLNIDPLTKAAFERPDTEFINCAVANKTDKLTSVSSRVMAGMTIKGGTGYSGITLDVDLIENSEYRPELQQAYVDDYRKILGDPLINDIIKESQQNIFIPK